MQARRFKTEAAAFAFLADQNRRGHLMWHMTMLHDDQCTRVRCVCHPEFVIEPLNEETMLRGIQATRRWIKETQS